MTCIISLFFNFLLLGSYLLKLHSFTEVNFKVILTMECGLTKLAVAHSVVAKSISAFYLYIVLTDQRTVIIQAKISDISKFSFSLPKKGCKRINKIYTTLDTVETALAVLEMCTLTINIKTTRC